MARKKKDGDDGARPLIPDDDADKPLEALARKQARLTSEIAERKGSLDEISEKIVALLKQRKNRAYVHGTFKLYIEAKEKLHVEVADETGEAA